MSSLAAANDLAFATVGQRQPERHLLISTQKEALQQRPRLASRRMSPARAGFVTTRPRKPRASTSPGSEQPPSELQRMEARSTQPGRNCVSTSRRHRLPGSSSTVCHRHGTVCAVAAAQHLACKPLLLHFCTYPDLLMHLTKSPVCSDVKSTVAIATCSHRILQVPGLL